MPENSVLIPSYFIMFVKTEMRLVIMDRLFRNSDETEEHLFMDTSTTYGADLYIESLVASLVEGLYPSNTYLPAI